LESNSSKDLASGLVFYCVLHQYVNA